MQVVPLLRVELFLDRTNRIEVHPSMQALAAALKGLAHDTVAAIATVPRVASLLTASQEAELLVSAA